MSEGAISGTDPGGVSEQQAETGDPFFFCYDREQPAYGLVPSSELDQYLNQCRPSGRALDLGAGPGRDSLALATAGLTVDSVDLSDRGLALLQSRASRKGLGKRVTTHPHDVRSFPIPPATYQVIVATTVLDHIPANDAETLWKRIIEGLAHRGLLYVEVHTVDDPGCADRPGGPSDAPVSETSPWVINYFARNQLLRMAIEQTGLRVLRYEERYEWDYTHGPEHQHAKAVLLATTADADPDWQGHPHAFPRGQSPGSASDAGSEQ